VTPVLERVAAAIARASAAARAEFQRDVASIRSWFARRSSPGAPGKRRWLRPRSIVLLAILALAIASAIGCVNFSRKVHALRLRHATGPGWSFPSRVYADGVALVAGRTAPRSWLVAHLIERGYREASAPFSEPGCYRSTASGLEIFLRGFDEAPDPAGIGGPERVEVTLANGRIEGVERLGGIAGRRLPDLTRPPRIEPVAIAWLDDDQRVRRVWTPLDRIPRVVQDAVIASEDRRFRGHFGIDLRSNLRALVSNVGAGGVREGGSTITQQLARALFLSRQRTMQRKLQEMGLAMGLEWVLSKDEILEMYLNSVYLGRGQGAQICGIGVASEWYFGVPPDSLRLEQAALLAGMIPAPNVFHPLRNPRAARARRDNVLSDMAVTGAIPADVAARAKTLPLGAIAGSLPRPRFPAYVSAVRAALEPQLPKGAIENSGLSIFTPMDMVWQEETEAALAEGVAWVERLLGRRPEPLQGAFAAIEPATGFVRAIAGGRQQSWAMYNRAVQAMRQPGSAIKPIVYAAALDPTRGGTPFNPGSTVPDLRREYATPEGPWRPRNDENDYHSSVTLAKALAKSLNIATANVVEAIGPRQVAQYAARFGLPGFAPVASIGLGTNEVTLMSLVAAYATFPQHGLRPTPALTRAVVDARGPIASGAPRPAVRVIPPATADLMTGLLEDVVIFGVSYPLRARWGFTRPVGGKTGTTNDYKDAWFVGFTPELAAGVWVGWDQPQSLTRPAAETALPVWANVMSALLQDFPATPFTPETPIELVWIDPWSGGRARGDCPSPLRVPFVKGTAPSQMCHLDHVSDWARIEAKRSADSLAADSVRHARPDSAAWRNRSM
jgi:penicillin-binding protein 1B